MSRPLSSPVFVGRADERKRLGGAWDRAVDGTAAIVLVGGDAGIGKSRLIAELGEDVRNDGGRWLLGGCPSQSGATQPYAPLVAALRMLIRTTPAAELDAAIGPARTELARLLPELGETGSEPVLADVLTTSAGRLFEVVLGLLHRLAIEHPVALVFEDVHWADPSTLDLVDFLARNLSDERILFLASYRTDELHRRHPLRPTLAELQRVGAVESIVLEGLSRGEVEELVGALLGQAPPREAVDRIAQRSGGLVFFVEELAAAIDDLDRLPPGLEELLRTRVDALSPEVQEIVRTVAAGACGYPVSDDLLARVTGMAPTALNALVREAVSHQVLAVVDGAYDFRHALVREVVVADLLPGERAGMHAMYATALSEGERALDDPATAARIAGHWLDAHELERAAAASFAAGKAADRAYAFAEAAQHYQQVLDLWAHIDHPEQLVGKERPKVATLAVQALMLSGDSPRAVALGRAELARDAKHRPDEPGGECRGQLAALVGRAMRAVGAMSEAIELLHSAIGDFPDEPSEARSLVKCEYATALVLDLQLLEADAAVQDALAEARLVGDAATIGRALNALGVLQLKHDRPDGLAALDEALERALAAEDVDGACRVYINLSDALRQLGAYQRSVDVADAGLAYMTERGLRRTTGAFINANRAEALVSLGRLREVVASIDDLPGGNAFDTHPQSTRAWALIRLGQVDGLGADLKKMASALKDMADKQCLASLQRSEAELAWTVGDANAMVAAVDEGLEIEHANGSLHYTGVLSMLGVRAEAERLLQPLARLSPEEHEQALARARALAATATGLAGQLAASMPAALAAALAIAELTRVDSPAAQRPATWVEAARIAGETGDRYHQAYAGWRLAEALLEADPSAGEQARLAAAAAHSLASGIGAAHLTTELRSLVRRARLEPLDTPAGRTGDRTTSTRDGSTSPRTEEGPEADPTAALTELGLTPREAEVLALLAEGCTNREIATRLYISVKTASVHVSNILAKLDVRTRVQAAAIAHRALAGN